MGNIGIFCQKPTTIMADSSFDSNKTLKVSGVSKLLQDQLIKEFQSPGNSTGFHDDVNKLYVCPQGQDYVLVEFAKDLPSDTAVVGNTLKIVGTKLDVEQWRPQAAVNDDSKHESVERIWQEEVSNPVLYTVCHPDQKQISAVPFGKTKVTLNKDFAKKIKEEDPKFGEILQKEDVKLRDGKLVGTWNAIYASGHKILSYITGGNQTENDKESSSSSHSVDPSDDPSTSTEQPLHAQHTKPDETLTVNWLFLRFIIAYHYEEYQKLESVCEEISFVAKSKIEKDLKLFVRKDVKKEMFHQSVNGFIDFYQAQNQKMHQEIILVPEEKAHVISETRTKFSVVIDSTDEPGKMIIFGEQGKVQEAVKFSEVKVCGLTPGVPPESKQATEGNPSKGVTGGGSAKVKSVIEEKLSCVLYQRIKLTVYRGDITKETADVIVNPANKKLDHGGGAAAAIVKAGGKSIQAESDEIIKNAQNNSLNPGSAVATAAGKLSCRFIVHAIGPVWNQYSKKDQAKKILYEAVWNSLGLASQYGARNISMPAISSGIFGVPVQICAEVLFAAATNFAKGVPTYVPLTEIRFVNIDKTTSQVFAQKMKTQFAGYVFKENFQISLSNNMEAKEEVDQHAQSALRQSGHTDFRPESHRHKSSANPKHPPSSRSLTAPTLKSYSSAVTGNMDKGKDKPPGAGPQGSVGSEEECPICLSKMTQKKTLHKCGHSFCAGCIDEAFQHQKKCPICSQVYGSLIGNQPPGKMIVSHTSISLNGYESCGSITITYKFEDGVQGPEHPTPGKKYFGITRSAFLPDNEEGNKVLKLLQQAFKQKLTFTIGRSSTSGLNNVITWNDIHHKTRRTGGATSFGYPDPSYLKRVQEELAAKGITDFVQETEL